MSREVYLYQVADNQESVGLYGTQGVVAQTAFTGVAALELLAVGKLQGYRGNPESGVRVAQEFSCDDFVGLQSEYGFPGGVLEMEDRKGHGPPVAVAWRPGKEAQLLVGRSKGPLRLVDLAP